MSHHVQLTLVQHGVKVDDLVDDVHGMRKQQGLKAAPAPKGSRFTDLVGSLRQSSQTDHEDSSSTEPSPRDADPRPRRGSSAASQRWQTGVGKLQERLKPSDQ